MLWQGEGREGVRRGTSRGGVGRRGSYGPRGADGPAEPGLAKYLKLKPGAKIRIGTMNIQGMMAVMVREEVEEWMRTSGVGVMALQEMHVAMNQVEKRRTHTWYFLETRRRV